MHHFSIIFLHKNGEVEPVFFGDSLVKSPELKMFPKVEKVQKGGGACQQQVQISKFALFDKRRGSPDFQVFPKYKCRL